MTNNIIHRELHRCNVLLASQVVAAGAGESLSLCLYYYLSFRTRQSRAQCESDRVVKCMHVLLNQALLVLKKKNYHHHHHQHVGLRMALEEFTGCCLPLPWTLSAILGADVRTQHQQVF